MWVLTGERERFCGIHLGGKSIRIADEAAGRGDDRLEPVDSSPVVTASLALRPSCAAYCCMIRKPAYACRKPTAHRNASPESERMSQTERCWVRHARVSAAKIFGA
jgi:hypothetical protein